ncbi:MAG TPA: hypothetical protein VK907_14585, partial [Phnomibacter sp.]|nr:hypothetical protein [Phnomibacter sp.]
YLFRQTIQLPSNVVIKGLGNARTIFSFDQSGRHEPSIRIRGRELPTVTPLQANATRWQNELIAEESQAAHVANGATIRTRQYDADLVYSSWAQYNTGQIVKVDSVKAGRLYLASPLRIDHPLSRQPGFTVIEPVAFTGIECIKIIRQDNANAGSGSANIEIRYAANCWVSSVESEKCNYGHVEVSHSRNLLFEDNYFHDAHSFGSGGRAYGVVLQYATGEVRVENNIFRRLRHSMLLQAGANGNVFAYNYSYQSRKESLPGVFITGEDMVCHGNYPYQNLFEGNYGQFASIDNSHGKNGPYNTFFRNLTTTSGFNITNSASPLQHLIANHRLSGSNTILSSGHHITDNSWQGNSGLSHPSLLYDKTPSFLTSTGIGKIGPPAFNTSVTIPARERMNIASPITRKCDIIIWDGDHWLHNMAPSLHTSAYGLIIPKGTQATIAEHTNVKSIALEMGSRLHVQQGIQLQIIQKKE